MATQAQIQALIDEIKSRANYPATKMNNLLSQILDFSSSGQTQVFDGLVANDTTSATTLILEYGVNIIDTSTETDYACKLPQPVTGKRVIVVNKSLMVVSLYPSSTGGRINDYNVNIPAIIPPDGKAYEFTCSSDSPVGNWVWSPPPTNIWDSGEITANSTGSTKWLISNGITTVERLGASSTLLGATDSKNVLYKDDASAAVFNPPTMWSAITKYKVYTNISSDLGGANPSYSALICSLGTNRYLAGTNTFYDNVFQQGGRYKTPEFQIIENIISGTVPPPGVTSNVADPGTLWGEAIFSGNNVLGRSSIGNRFISTDGTYDTWESVILSLAFNTGRSISGVKFRFFIEYY